MKRPVHGKAAGVRSCACCPPVTVWQAEREKQAKLLAQQDAMEARVKVCLQSLCGRGCAPSDTALNPAACPGQCVVSAV